MSDQPDLSTLSDATAPSPSDSNAVLSEDWNYETTVAEVEDIIRQIEMGELPLAELFDQFAVAVERLRQCETFLNRQQQQVDLLIETLLDESELF